MTERRREIVRTQIARAAVRLFTENGVSGTTGDDIAHALGISTRTLWRYFPTKESCVRPLLSEGLDRMADCLRACPEGVSLVEYLEGERSFDAGAPDLEEPVADLIRMVDREPGLKAVWLEVHHTAESVFAGIIAERTGEPADSLPVRVQAATLNAALRLAAEEQARLRGRSRDGAPARGTGPLVRAALAAAARGLPAFGHDRGDAPSR
jgi:AcrR family transcriptional regulator